MLIILPHTIIILSNNCFTNLIITSGLYYETRRTNIIFTVVMFENIIFFSYDSHAKRLSTSLEKLIF